MSGAPKKSAPKRQRLVPLERVLRRLVWMCFIPLILVALVMLGSLMLYSYSYNSILHNVTVASEFNQSFKENIDLTMYYYVVGSKYSTGLPTAEVQNAQQLAAELIDTTTDKQSRKAIRSVLNLSRNLEDKMNQIAATESYDERETKLEDNIYVLTDLIQDYMYTYLYYESVQLNELQAALALRMRYGVAGLALGVTALLCLLFYEARKTTSGISGEMQALAERVRCIGSGDLSPAPPITAGTTEVAALSAGIEEMAGRISTLMEQSRQEQATLRNKELALLQAQISPHFLYNTLDTIVWQIETENYDDAEQMVTSLSSFFRTSLSGGRDIITVAEEANHVRSYMEIQQMRYRDILRYQIEIDPAMNELKIPKLTLQPLVENSLYHGIKLKRGVGTITVRGTLDGADACLTVTDDGPGMDAATLEKLRASLRGETKAGFGLVAVHERLRLLFGKGYGLQLESVPGCTTVTVRIPAQTPPTPQLPQTGAPEETQP